MRHTENAQQNDRNKFSLSNKPLNISGLNSPIKRPKIDRTNKKNMIQVFTVCKRFTLDLKPQISWKQKNGRSIQTVTKRELGGCTNIRQDRLKIKSIWYNKGHYILIKQSSHQ